MRPKISIIALLVLGVMTPGVGEAAGHLVAEVSGRSIDHAPPISQHRDSGPELPCTGIHVCPCHPQFQGHTPPDGEPLLAAPIPLLSLTLGERPVLAEGHPTPLYRPPIF